MKKSNNNLILFHQIKKKPTIKPKTENKNYLTELNRNNNNNKKQNQTKIKNII